MQSHAITCNHMQSATHLSHVARKVELGQRAAREPTDEAGTQARLSQLDDTCIGPKRHRERARISRLGDRRGAVAAARDGARECGPARARVIQRATGALSNSEPERAKGSSAFINGHQWQSREIKGHQWSSVAIKGDQRSSVGISGHQRQSRAISGHQGQLAAHRAEASKTVDRYSRASCTAESVSIGRPACTCFASAAATAAASVHPAP